jgi:hypothetical protein
LWNLLFWELSENDAFVIGLVFGIPYVLFIMYLTRHFLRYHTSLIPKAWTELKYLSSYLFRCIFCMKPVEEPKIRMSLREDIEFTTYFIVYV